MSPLDPALGGLMPDAAPRSATNARASSPDTEWLRQLQRAQWAGLGENLDRDSPTSAAQPRDAAERRAREALAKEPSNTREERRDPADGQDVASMAASPALVPMAFAPAPLAPTAFVPAPLAPPVGAEAHVATIDHDANASPGAAPIDASLLHARGIDRQADPHAASTAPAAPASTLAPRAKGSDAIDAVASTTAAALTQRLRMALSMHGTDSALHALDAPASMNEPATVPEGIGEAAEEARGAPASARHDPPAARAMRVFTSEEGAQVFVRDAALDGAAAQALVARVAAELALSGTRLAALTVNGRAVFEAAALRGTRGGALPVSKPNDDSEGR